MKLPDVAAFRLRNLRKLSAEQDSADQEVDCSEDDDDRRGHIRAYITQLRKKIEYSDSRRYIVTESWIGYRFCASGEGSL